MPRWCARLFAPGKTTKTINVAVKGDTTVEPDETMSVSLSVPVNATVASGSATGSIKNDDRQTPRVGRYTGTTSQNRAIQFDVTPDGQSLTNVVFHIDIECANIDFRLQDEPIDFGNSLIPLRSDYSSTSRTPGAVTTFRSTSPSPVRSACRDPHPEHFASTTGSIRPSVPLPARPTPLPGGRHQLLAVSSWRC